MSDTFVEHNRGNNISDGTTRPPADQFGQTTATMTRCDALSSDVMFTIFGHLDMVSLVHASSTCKAWHTLANSEDLWKQHWLDRRPQTSHSMLSSNEMGGCAVKVSYDVQRQASRACEVVNGAPTSQPQQSQQSSQQQQFQQNLLEATGSPGPGSAVTSNGGVSTDMSQPTWRDMCRHNLEVERNWSSGQCTVKTMEGHNDFIRCLQLSGNTMVTCSGSTSHQDCSIRIWDVQDQSCRRVLRGHMGPIWCMMYEPSVDRIASGSDDYTVRYWDACTGNSVVMQDPDSAVRCIHMDAQGRQLVAGTEFGRLLLWDLDHLEEVLNDAVEHVVAEFERLEQAAGRGPGGGGPSASSRRSFSDVNAAAGNPGQRRRGRASTPRGQQILAGRHIEADGSNHVRVMDIAEEGTAITAIQVQSGLCASTRNDPMSRIQLWDVSRNSWTPAGSLGDAGMNCANSLSFDKQIGVLVAGCGDGGVRVWDLNSGARRHLLRGHHEEVVSHQFDDNIIASAGMDGRICIWDTRSGECRHVLNHNTALHAFQFNDDKLVSGTWDGRVYLWDLRRGTLVQDWYTHNERVWAIALDDYYIASAGLDRNVCLHSFLPQNVPQQPSRSPSPYTMDVADTANNSAAASLPAGNAQLTEQGVAAVNANTAQQLQQSAPMAVPNGSSTGASSRTAMAVGSSNFGGSSNLALHRDGSSSSSASLSECMLRSVSLGPDERAAAHGGSAAGTAQHASVSDDAPHQHHHRHMDSSSTDPGSADMDSPQHEQHKQHRSGTGMEVDGAQKEHAAAAASPSRSTDASMAQSMDMC